MRGVVQIAGWNRGTVCDRYRYRPYMRLCSVLASPPRNMPDHAYVIENQLTLYEFVIILYLPVAFDKTHRGCMYLQGLYVTY